MEIRHLQYFLAVVKENGFTSAAEKLYVSQSSVSKAISKIEKDLGYLLFDPKQKRPCLTPAGAAFHERALRLVGEYDRFLSESQSHGNGVTVSGIISVGIPPLISTCYFAPVMASFAAAFPKVEVRLAEAGSISIQNYVDKGLIDAGVVILPIYDEKFEAIPLISDRTVAVVSDSHPLSGREKVSYPELKGEKFILFDKAYTLYHQITANCRNAGFEPFISSTSGSWDYITELVSLNQGMSILPRPIFKKWAYSHIRILELSGDNTGWTVVMITKKGGSQSGAVNSFVRHTKDHFRLI